MTIRVAAARFGAEDLRGRPRRVKRGHEEVGVSRWVIGHDGWVNLPPVIGLSTPVVVGNDNGSP